MREHLVDNMLGLNAVFEFKPQENFTSDVLELAAPSWSFFSLLNTFHPGGSEQVVPSPAVNLCTQK